MNLTQNYNDLTLLNHMQLVDHNNNIDKGEGRKYFILFKKNNIMHISIYRFKLGDETKLFSPPKKKEKKKKNQTHQREKQNLKFLNKILKF